MASVPARLRITAVLVIVSGLVWLLSASPVFANFLDRLQVDEKCDSTLHTVTIFTSQINDSGHFVTFIGQILVGGTWTDTGSPVKVDIPVGATSTTAKVTIEPAGVTYRVRVVDSDLGNASGAVSNEVNCVKSTPSPTPTSTSTPTATASPTATVTPTASITPTATSSTPSNSPTPTITPTATSSPASNVTPTPTPTMTPPPSTGGGGGGGGTSHPSKPAPTAVLEQPAPPAQAVVVSAPPAAAPPPPVVEAAPPPPTPTSTPTIEVAGARPLTTLPPPAAISPVVAAPPPCLETAAIASMTPLIDGTTGEQAVDATTGLPMWLTIGDDTGAVTLGMACESAAGTQLGLPATGDGTTAVPDGDSVLVP